MTSTVHRAITLALIIVGSTSCRLGKVTVPDFAGPSGFGVGLALSATPDLLQRDGRTTSVVTVSAYDGSNKPVANLGLHLDLSLEGGTGGLGTLSQKEVTTGSDGRATVIYTSPLPAPLTQSDEATINISVLPVGTNGGNATGTALTIRLIAANQAGGPTASFVFGPKAPKLGDTILFDASASQPSIGSSIVTYAWDFGDGNAFVRVPYLTSPGPTITHEYNKSGPFTVGLTIVDSAGKRNTATFALFVQ